MSGADAVGTVCLVVGLLTRLGGASLGIYLSVTKGTTKSDKTMATAKQRLQEVEEQTTATKHEIEGLQTRGLDAGGVPDTSKAASAADQAVQSTQAAKSAIEQVEGAIASLPEHLRFAGLLVMVGTVLIGVATIQFGGTPLF